MSGENYSAGLARARAEADRQRKLNEDALAKLIKQVRDMLSSGRDPSDTWAILGAQVANELDCYGRYPQFAVEMLVTAAMQLAQTQSARDGGAG